MHDIDAILGKMREAIPAGPVRIKNSVFYTQNQSVTNKRQFL